MKRFVELLTWLAISMCSPVYAAVVGGMDFPNPLGGFELRSVIDNEMSNPGLGVTLLYNAPGVKVAVFVYNYSQSNIPDGINSTLIQKEFSKARSNIQQVYPDAQTLVGVEKLRVKGTSVLHSAFHYTEIRQESREAVISHLYLLAKNGNFVKVRATFSSSDRPELGSRIQAHFIEDLCRMVAKQHLTERPPRKTLSD